ncbi:hypothetical protein BURC_03470 [Burkholderiaceae bacterium]|nr:hypothetical protein BURC_03470 [Burkholderiaceae bacterium]
MTIRHVVLWRLHQPTEAERFAQELRSCAGIVPGMLGFEVAARSAHIDGSADVCLIASFADEAALRAYEQHPLHRRVSAALAPVRRERHAMDFEVPA